MLFARRNAIIIYADPRWTSDGLGARGSRNIIISKTAVDASVCIILLLYVYVGTPPGGGDDFFVCRRYDYYIIKFKGGRPPRWNVFIDGF